jgi:hypothetical protein
MSTKSHIESSYNRLFASCSKKPTEAQLQEARALRRIAAAWDSLQSCLAMDEADMDFGPGRALAEAALAMLDRPDIRELALAELAEQSIRSDRPLLWQFCADHGFDPMSKTMASHERIWSLSRMDDKPSSLICKAMLHGAWRFVDMISQRPEGRMGMPEPEPKPHAGVKNPRAKAEPDAWAKRWESEWWALNDPILFDWRRVDMDGQDPMPKALAKALADRGFGARFDVPAFALGATQLALEGSMQALRACAEARADPSAALLMLSERHSFRCAPIVARLGGLIGDKHYIKSWAKAKAWIDHHAGPGSSEALLHDAAIEILSSWTPRHNEWGRATTEPALAIGLLCAHGPMRPEQANKELVMMQNLSIELAEVDKDKPRPEFARVAELMNQWSAALGSPAKPRKLLKA